MDSKYIYEHCLKSNLAQAVYEANECSSNPNGYACDLGKFFKANQYCCKSYIQEDFNPLYLQQCLYENYFN